MFEFDHVGADDDFSGGRLFLDPDTGEPVHFQF
jgi:hypothetical protein